MSDTKATVRDFGGFACVVCQKQFGDGAQSRRNRTAVRVETKWAHYHGYSCALCLSFLADNQIHHADSSPTTETGRHQGGAFIKPQPAPFGRGMTIAKAQEIMHQVPHYSSNVSGKRKEQVW